MSLAGHPAVFSVDDGRAGPRRLLVTEGDPAAARAAVQGEREALAERARAVAADGRVENRVLTVGAVVGLVGGLVAVVLLQAGDTWFDWVLAALGGAGVGYVLAALWRGFGLPPRRRPLPPLRPAEVAVVALPEVLWEHADPSTPIERLQEWRITIERERSARMVLEQAYDIVHDHPERYSRGGDGGPRDPYPSWVEPEELPGIEEQYRLAYARYAEVARAVGFTPRGPATIRSEDQG